MSSVLHFPSSSWCQFKKRQKIRKSNAAAVMLTCDICGEEMLLADDMKTHLLLSHLENDTSCPLCSLSGVSYDELCFHISSAHSESRQTTPANTSDSSTATDTGALGIEKPRNSQSCSANNGWEGACEVQPSGSSGVTSGETSSNPLPTRSPETRQATVRHYAQDKSGLHSGHSKAKQKRLSDTRQEELLSCPMCALVCSSSDLLQEHVELHLQEQSSADGKKALECPMCSAVFHDSISLQEHVELHLDQGATCVAVGGPDSDIELVRKLQQQEEAAQEEREFKKLQRQFGLDSRGGYRQQMERTMETAVARGLMDPSEFHCKRAEMMESLASGLDDAQTRTAGLVRALYDYYQTESKDCAHVWLSVDTDHYCSSSGDKGWGCGYRNLQMLVSSLHRADVYSPSLPDKCVPSIPRLQSMIEQAWKEGLDPQGASHFSQRLQGTRAWIGATEIYTLLTSLGISSRIIDFHQPTGPSGTHPRLFDWVKQYYGQSSRSGRLPARLVQTALPPLYLQHQGHSRTIVGLEQRKNGSLCLLVLDPAASVSDARKLLSRAGVSTAVRHIRKFPSNLKHKQYQVVSVHGTLSSEEKQIRILNSRTLRAERIP